MPILTEVPISDLRKDMPSVKYTRVPAKSVPLSFPLMPNASHNFAGPLVRACIVPGLLPNRRFFFITSIPATGSTARISTGLPRVMMSRHHIRAEVHAVREIRRTKNPPCRNMTLFRCVFPRYAWLAGSLRPRYASTSTMVPESIVLPDFRTRVFPKRSFATSKADRV